MDTLMDVPLQTSYCLVLERNLLFPFQIDFSQSFGNMYFDKIAGIAGPIVIWCSSRLISSLLCVKYAYVLLSG